MGVGEHGLLPFDDEGLGTFLYRTSIYQASEKSFFNATLSDRLGIGRCAEGSQCIDRVFRDSFESEMRRFQGYRGQRGKDGVTRPPMTVVQQYSIDDGRQYPSSTYAPPTDSLIMIHLLDLVFNVQQNTSHLSRAISFALPLPDRT